MHTLTPEDWAFWQENGYVVVHNAVPQENLDALIDTIWEFTGLDRDDPSTWNEEATPENGLAKRNSAGMVEMYQHQAMWNNRQHPRLYGAFADIWRADKLWVSIDRVNLNTPAPPDAEFGGFVHWDMDTKKRPLPFQVQGVLSLTDTSFDQGGFQCVPGFVNLFEEWVKTQPEDRDPWHPDLTGFEVVPIETKAGDLVIWHSLLPHGTRRNNSKIPRLAQYITMSPAREDNDEDREHRINIWRNRLPPGGRPFPGDARRIEEDHGTTAELTPLGRKLLGLDRWEAGA